MEKEGGGILACNNCLTPMVYLVQYRPNMLRKHTFSSSFMKREEGVKTQRPRRKTLVEIKNF
ncbi:MAG: hypothetical protein NTY29_08345, partial [Proteobacteria bacterium]|nr:hypothetical protein [Pseudomonadota bacterium]